MSAEKNKQILIAWTVFGFTLVYVVGCGGLSNILTPSPTVVVATVSVSEDANPDLRGRHLPIVVRLFQISAPGEFEQSDFFELLEGTPTLAGNGYQLLDELEMAGGETRSGKHELDSLARYVGVVAAFRQIEFAQWLAVAPVEATALNQVNINVQRLQADVSSQPVE